MKITDKSDYLHVPSDMMKRVRIDGNAFPYRTGNSQTVLRPEDIVYLREAYEERREKVAADSEIAMAWHEAMPKRDKHDIDITGVYGAISNIWGRFIDRSLLDENQDFTLKLKYNRADEGRKESGEAQIAARKDALEEEKEVLEDTRDAEIENERKSAGEVLESKQSDIASAQTAVEDAKTIFEGESSRLEAVYKQAIKNIEQMEQLTPEQREAETAKALSEYSTGYTNARNTYENVLTENSAVIVQSKETISAKLREMDDNIQEARDNCIDDTEDAEDNAWAGIRAIAETTANVDDQNWMSMMHIDEIRQRWKKWAAMGDMKSDEVWKTWERKFVYIDKNGDEQEINDEDRYRRRSCYTLSNQMRWMFRDLDHMRSVCVVRDVCFEGCNNITSFNSPDMSWTETIFRQRQSLSGLKIRDRGVKSEAGSTGTGTFVSSYSSSRILMQIGNREDEGRIKGVSATIIGIGKFSSSSGENEKNGWAVKTGRVQFYFVSRMNGDILDKIDAIRDDAELRKKANIVAGEERKNALYATLQDQIQELDSAFEEFESEKNAKLKQFSDETYAEAMGRINGKDNSANETVASLMAEGKIPAARLVANECEREAIELYEQAEEAVYQKEQETKLAIQNKKYEIDDNKASIKQAYGDDCADIDYEIEEENSDIDDEAQDDIDELYQSIQDKRDEAASARDDAYKMASDAEKAAEDNAYSALDAAVRSIFSGKDDVIGWWDEYGTDFIKEAKKQTGLDIIYEYPNEYAKYMVKYNEYQAAIKKASEEKTKADYIAMSDYNRAIDGIGEIDENGREVWAADISRFLGQGEVAKSYSGVAERDEEYSFLSDEFDEIKVEDIVVEYDFMTDTGIDYDDDE